MTRTTPIRVPFLFTGETELNHTQTSSDAWLCWAAVCGIGCILVWGRATPTRLQHAYWCGEGLHLPGCSMHTGVGKGYTYQAAACILVWGRATPTRLQHAYWCGEGLHLPGCSMHTGVGKGYTYQAAACILVWGRATPTRLQETVYEEDDQHNIREDSCEVYNLK